MKYILKLYFFAADMPKNQVMTTLIIEHILIQLISHIGRFLQGLPTMFTRNERSLSQKVY